MTTYTKATNFTAKDALLTGNPSKLVKGSEIDAEFNAIQAADATSVKGSGTAVTDNAIVRFDSTTGYLVQGSGVTVSDGNVVTATGFAGPINGTVGATTPSTGAFTTLAASGAISGTTATPSLTLTATGTNNPIITLEDNGSRTAIFSGPTSPGIDYARLGTTSSHNLALITANTVRATIDASGLAVTGALSTTGNVQASASANFGTTSGFCNFGAAGAAIVSAGAGANVSFRPNGGGDIVTVSPTGLAVSGNILSVSGTGGATAFNLTDATSNIGINTLPAAAADFYITNSRNASTIRFRTSNATDGDTTPLVISNSGVAVTGAASTTTGIAVGGATAGAGGIAFPATAVAVADVNTLDDYEEGTWTPSLGGTAAYTGRGGEYTKIGNVVFFSGYINVNTIGTGSTTVISGLPFTSSAAGTGSTAAVNYFATSVTNVTYLVGRVTSSGTSITLYSANAATATLSANAIFQNSTGIYFSGQYFV